MGVDSGVNLFIVPVLFIVGVLLGHMAMYDYKHKEIQAWAIAVLYLLVVVYLLMGGNDFRVAGISMIFMACIFAVPCLFYMGIGDLLLFVGLGAFIGSEDALWLFLSVLLVFWVLATLGVIARHPSVLKSKKELLTKEYPLVPVIVISFACWSALGGIQ